MIRPNDMSSMIRDALRNQRGQTLIEYGMVLILIAIILIAVVTFVGTKTCNMYSKIGTDLPTTSSP